MPVSRTTTTRASRPSRAEASTVTGLRARAADGSQFAEPAFGTLNHADARLLGAAALWPSVPPVVSASSAASTALVTPLDQSPSGVSGDLDDSAVVRSTAYWNPANPLCVRALVFRYARLYLARLVAEFSASNSSPAFTASSTSRFGESPFEALR